MANEKIWQKARILPRVEEVFKALVGQKIWTMSAPFTPENCIYLFDCEGNLEWREERNIENAPAVIRTSIYTSTLKKQIVIELTSIELLPEFSTNPPWENLEEMLKRGKHGGKVPC